MKPVFSSLLATSLFVGSFALAQSTEDTTKTEEAPAASEIQPSTDESFPVANAEVQDGQPYIREKHENWTVRCIKGRDELPCNLYMLLLNENGDSVAEMNIEALPEGNKAAAGVTFVSPLGTSLVEGVSMRIDSGKARNYPFRWCEQSGCISRFGLTSGDIASMKKGANAKFTVAAIADPSKPINLEVSLSGFTAAWNAVSAK